MENIKCPDNNNQFQGDRNMVDWVCLKCGYKWVCKSKDEPRQCPMCGCCVIYVPKLIKKK